jgi:histidine triad (HIT) family protein
MADCIFCNIIKFRPENGVVVFEDETTVAFIALHQKPKNLRHTLVIPKTHVPDLWQLPEQLDKSLMAAIRKLAQASKKAFSADGVQIKQNNGTASGQGVFHLHFHVIPRFNDDNFDHEHYEVLDLERRLDLGRAIRLAI